VTETVVIHTTREKKRNAGGASLGGKASPVLPIIGGIAGGAATVYATSKLNAHPVAIAAGAAVGGMALAAASKTPWVKQAAMGAAIGAGTLGGVTLVGNLLASSPKPAPSAPPPKKRAADGERDADGAADGYVTRAELNDALSKLADSHKETQKQQTCDLLTALRDEMKKVIAEGPNGPGVPTTTSPPPVAKQPGVMPMQFTYPFVPRAAEGDEYMRNAYGDDLRDADVDEYTRNAYGDDVRDAAPYYDERDAGVYDERDAAAYYDERDAALYDERDAGGYDERDADGFDERNGDLTDEQLAQIQASRSMM
jgi:hypothetical protein